MHPSQMSWEKAKEEAAAWLRAAGVSKKPGRSVDLSKHALPFTGVFREMVMDAVQRRLRRLGVRDITLPPKPPEAE